MDSRLHAIASQPCLLVSFDGGNGVTPEPWRSVVSSTKKKKNKTTKILLLLWSSKRPGHHTIEPTRFNLEYPAAALYPGIVTFGLKGRWQVEPPPRERESSPDQSLPPSCSGFASRFRSHWNRANFKLGLNPSSPFRKKIKAEKNPELFWKKFQSVETRSLAPVLEPVLIQQD